MLALLLGVTRALCGVRLLISTCGLPFTLLRAAIYPYADSPWDGRHFCAEDWHVLVAGWSAPIDELHTVQEAKDELAATTIRLVLDGMELDTEHTAIRRMPEQPEGAPEAEAFYFCKAELLRRVS